MESGPKPGGITRDDWLRAMDAATAARVPESDALTVQEFARLVGVARETADKRLARLVETGLAEKTTKVIQRCDGRIMSTTAYRLLKKTTP